MRSHKINLVFIALLLTTGILLWLEGQKSMPVSLPSAPPKNCCSRQCSPASPLNFISNGLFKLSPV